VTAWFNLAGLVTVLAAINVGTYRFTAGALLPNEKPDELSQFVGVTVITASQAVLNNLGIRITRVLTDLSGYWILLIATLVTISLLSFAPALDPTRLITFTNFSGFPEEEPVWPWTDSLVWLFALGFLLPAYTITGFDASAHLAEETASASRNVPRGIVRSVFVSGVLGWAMLCAAVMAIQDPIAAAGKGEQAFVFILSDILPRWLYLGLCGGVVVAQYLCGLATLTSASRMVFAFARDGGLPASRWLRHVSPRFRTPPVAIWSVALAAVLFTVYSPVYSTITAVCVIFLYVSYVLPTTIGVVAYRKWWSEMGPWQLGPWFRPLALASIIGCAGLIAIGMQPPNEKAAYVVGATMLALVILWFAVAQRRFPGPPHGTLTALQRQAIREAEVAVHETSGNQL
jgi:amino acid transporter